MKKSSLAEALAKESGIALPVVNNVLNALISRMNGDLLDSGIFSMPDVGDLTKAVRVYPRIKGNKSVLIDIGAIDPIRVAPPKRFKKSTVPAKPKHNPFKKGPIPPIAARSKAVKALKLRKGGGGSIPPIPGPP